MKMLKFLAVTMLCAVTGINFELQAKIDICSLFKKETPCNKSDACSWANGVCSNKTATQSGTSTSPNGGSPSVPVDVTNAGQVFTPNVIQEFTPDAQFADAQATAGSYDSKTQTAQIIGASKSYTFTGVKEFSTMVRPFGLTKIGTFANPNYAPSNASCSGCQSRTITLYGTLGTNSINQVVTVQ